MKNIRAIATTLRNDRRGVTALEYAMIASLIAVACVSILTSLGVQLQTVFTQVSAAL